MVKKKNGTISISAIFALGNNVATVLRDAYKSEDADEKFNSIDEIRALNISSAAKLKFIGDIIQRPKRERMIISDDISTMLNIKEEEVKE